MYKPVSLAKGTCGVGQHATKVLKLSMYHLLPLNHAFQHSVTSLAEPDTHANTVAACLYGSRFASVYPLRHDMVSSPCAFDTACLPAGCQVTSCECRSCVSQLCM